MTTYHNHQARKVGETVLKRIKALKIGQKMQDLPEELWHESFRYYVKEDPTRQGGPNLRMIRLDPNQPSLTVTGYIYNKFVHPFYDRFITPREAARLQGFPDDLEFKGSLTSVQRQIGDAVPIELGEAIFRQLLTFVKAQAPHQKQFYALSLFSGAGGLEVANSRVCTSDNSHFKTIACVEIEKDRCDTLREYFGDDLSIIQADIRDVSAQTIFRDSLIAMRDVWLIYGGPPCQSFSQAGKQKGQHDPRGELIFEFLRVVDEISPPLLMMENVANLKAIDKGRLLQSILDEMDNMGYDVTYGVLNSAQYGNAQKRQRLIFFGVKKIYCQKINLPEPTHGEHVDLFGKPVFKTVAQAFDGLPEETD